MSIEPTLVRTCLVAIAGVHFFSAAVARDTGEFTQRPNIVFILADDLGYGDLGCYGRTDIQTRRLDRMASEGVRLTAHYANGPECTPTRAAFMTGRYQQWIGGLECAIGTGNVGRYDDAVRLRETHDLGLPVSLPTLPRALRNAGYETGLTGKWHLGYEPKFAPKHFGFDQSYYCVGGEMDYFHFTDNANLYNLYQNCSPIQDDGYFTDLVTSQAIEFIQQKRQAPFFLYVPYTCPHAPFQGPDDAEEEPLPPTSVRWKQGKAPPDVYRAMIERMDQGIGKILDAVDNNTLVVFTSDNGGTGSARNTPFRGTKGGTFEGGIRVPAMIWWPEKLEPSEFHIPTVTFDWTRTFIDLANADWPATHALEGINVLQALSTPPPLRALFWRKPRGTQVWKGVRHGNLKYVCDRRGDKEREYLFCLNDDPEESDNLIERDPENAKRLRGLFDQWEAKTRKDRRGRVENLWAPKSPRSEIRPEFTALPDGRLRISADGRAGLCGSWVREFPVTSGTPFHFRAECVATGVSHPRREVLARVVWQTQDGQAVTRENDRTAVLTKRGGRIKAEPEFPGGTTSGETTVFEGTYVAPPGAEKAVVELHLRWAAPGASVEWTRIDFEAVERMPTRPVKLATVHYRPQSGTTNREKCMQFAKFIGDAGTQGVDLIVLPESLTYFSSGRSHVDCAETIPGPSTEYFGGLARKHDLYIVAGLIERDGRLVYNTSVLVGPDGELVGRYRKVSLPRGEIEAGLTPGNSLPVFETRFGKVGMMICYDGFFPEVAQGLAEQGADVIAWPVWGCNPLLAQARACENHVYVVSSTYTPSDKKWIRSAVYGHDGKMLVAAEDFGTMVVTEVDLEERLHWQSLGDFKAQLPAHRPLLLRR